MQVDLNGQLLPTTAATLADLIAERGLDAASCATAMNGQFVPRGMRAQTPLHPGARIEVLLPMQGG